MAEPEGSGEPGRTHPSGHPVIQAAKVAVGLLRAAWDHDNQFSRSGTRSLLEELSAVQLAQVAAVQTVWMLEQMEWIANVEHDEGAMLSVEEPICGLGMEIALSETDA